MNKKIIIILLLFLSFFTIFNFATVKADSGWDTDFDSGSSFGSGSSYDSGSDFGSGSGRGYNYGIDDLSKLELTIFLIFVIIAIGSVGSIIVIIFIYPKLHDLYLSKAIKNAIPSFNDEEFLENAYKDFIKLQNAWSNFDYDAMKPLISDEMFNIYKSQLKVLSAKKQKNVMHGFLKRTMNIVKFKSENGISTIEVILYISFFDYITDDENKIVRGNNNTRVNNQYRLTYSRNESNSNKCPKCGAEVVNSHAGRCEYCRSVITNNNHDWILVKKEIIKSF